MTTEWGQWESSKQGKAEHEEEEEDGASNEGTMCWQVDKCTWDNILTNNTKLKLNPMLWGKAELKMRSLNYSAYRYIW